MRIIIAPAKKMNTDLDSLPPEGLPLFLDRTERLQTALVLNLASREYSRAVESHLPLSVRFLTCPFCGKQLRVPY